MDDKILARLNAIYELLGELINLMIKDEEWKADSQIRSPAHEDLINSGKVGEDRP